MNAAISLSLRGEGGGGGGGLWRVPERPPKRGHDRDAGERNTKREQKREK